MQQWFVIAYVRSSHPISRYPRIWRLFCVFWNLREAWRGKNSCLVVSVYSCVHRFICKLCGICHCQFRNIATGKEMFLYFLVLLMYVIKADVYQGFDISFFCSYLLIKNCFLSFYCCCTQFSCTHVLYIPTAIIAVKLHKYWFICDQFALWNLFTV